MEIPGPGGRKYMWGNPPRIFHQPSEDPTVFKPAQGSNLTISSLSIWVTLEAQDTTDMKDRLFAAFEQVLPSD
jgi:hypothetical protein